MNKKQIITSDSFESELIAELVRQRFSYKVIHQYLKLMKMCHPKRDQSLRYHAVKHDVSLTSSRHDIHAVRATALQMESPGKKVKHG